jgi:hypothetical protein
MVQAAQFARAENNRGASKSDEISRTRWRSSKIRRESCRGPTRISPGMLKTLKSASSEPVTLRRACWAAGR